VDLHGRKRDLVLEFKDNKIAQAEKAVVLLERAKTWLAGAEQLSAMPSKKGDWTFYPVNAAKGSLIAPARPHEK
jgi:hypothetical protein